MNDQHFHVWGIPQPVGSPNLTPTHNRGVATCYSRWNCYHESRAVVPKWCQFCTSLNWVCSVRSRPPSRGYRS